MKLKNNQWVNWFITLMLNKGEFGLEDDCVRESEVASLWLDSAWQNLLRALYLFLNPSITWQKLIIKFYIITLHLINHFSGYFYSHKDNIMFLFIKAECMLISGYSYTFAIVLPFCLVKHAKQKWKNPET